MAQLQTTRRGIVTRRARIVARFCHASSQRERDDDGDGLRCVRSSSAKVASNAGPWVPRGMRFDDDHHMLHHPRFHYLTIMPVYPGALALASLLAGHGLRKGSLSSSGAIAALTVGYLSLANPVKAFGFTLLLFYLAGSRATKVGHQIKAALEMEFDSGALDKRSHQDGKPKQAGTGQVHKAAAGGQRDAWQVLCNSLLSAVSALIFRLLYEGEWQWKEGKAWCLFEGAPSYAGTSSAAVKAIQHNLGIPAAHLIGPHTPRLLFLIMLGHFSVRVSR